MHSIFISPIFHDSSLSHYLLILLLLPLSLSSSTLSSCLFLFCSLSFSNLVILSPPSFTDAISPVFFSSSFGLTHFPPSLSLVKMFLSPSLYLPVTLREFISLYYNSSFFSSSTCSSLRYSISPDVFFSISLWFRAFMLLCSLGCWVLAVSGWKGRIVFCLTVYCFLCISWNFDLTHIRLFLFSLTLCMSCAFFVLQLVKEIDSEYFGVFFNTSNV